MVGARKLATVRRRDARFWRVASSGASVRAWLVVPGGCERGASDDGVRARARRESDAPRRRANGWSVSWQRPARSSTVELRGQPPLESRVERRVVSRVETCVATARSAPRPPQRPQCSAADDLRCSLAVRSLKIAAIAAPPSFCGSRPLGPAGCPARWCD